MKCYPRNFWKNWRRNYEIKTSIISRTDETFAGAWADTSDGSMCFEWNESDSDNMVVTSPDADTNYDYYHETYTLQDILDKLPPVIKKYYWLAIRVSAHKGMWYVEYNGRGCTLSYFYSENLIDAAYGMLCWCIEKQIY